MSLNGALFTGVSSLAANSRALGVSSNNIANVNTVSYKSSNAQFTTFLSRDTVAGDFSPNLVQGVAQQQLGRQGAIQRSESTTDLAISGQGFFVVSQVPTETSGSVNLLYTRAGSFTPDGEGNLKNAQGAYLMGWKLNGSGSIPSNASELSTVSVGNIAGDAQATSAVTISGNFQASTEAEGSYATGDISSGAVGADYQRTIEICDSQGGVHPIRLGVVKTAANTWAYEAIYDGDVANIGGPTNNPVGSGTVTFGTDGMILTPAAPAYVTVPWAASSGLSPQSFALDFGSPAAAGSVTQYEAPTLITPINVDGASPGKLAGVSISKDGYVSAVFDNGTARAIYKVPLANFANPSGLTALSSNLYRYSADSGPAILVEADGSGAGSIIASGLEASTVDLSKEFTDMITTQRAYSAATRIISTADAMLQEMLSIKR